MNTMNRLKKVYLGDCTVILESLVLRRMDPPYSLRLRSEAFLLRLQNQDYYALHPRQKDKTPLIAPVAAP